MFDLNRYDFISLQFCGCPQTLWRSDAGNFPIRSHLVRLREIMSRNAWHDVHRESFFPISNRQYFKLYWLYPRRRIWSDFVFVTYSIGGDELSTDNKPISRMKGLSIPDWLQIWLGCTKLQDEQIERFGSSKLRCDYMAAVQDQNRVTSSCRLGFPNVRYEPLGFHI